MGQGGMDRHTDEWMDVWTDGHTAEDTDGQTDSSCVLQDFVPLGPLPKSVRWSAVPVPCLSKL